MSFEKRANDIKLERRKADLFSIEEFFEHLKEFREGKRQKMKPINFYHLVKSKLENLDLSGLDFEGCDLDFVKFINCDLTSSKFDYSRGYATTFDNSKLDKASFDGCKFEFSTFSNVKFEKMFLKEIIFDKCYFTNVGMTKSKLRSCIFKDVKFNAVDMREVSFDKKTQWPKTSLKGVKIDLEDINIKYLTKPLVRMFIELNKDEAIEEFEKMKIKNWEIV